MCAIQELPNDIIEDVLKSNDETLIALLHHNKKLESYFVTK